MPYSPEMMDDVIRAQDDFAWEAPAWEYHERGSKWYMVMAVLAIGFLVYALWIGNFLFAFLILLMAIMLVLAGNKRPETILVQIGSNGVVINGRFYEFRELSNFSIIFQPPETKVLYIEPKNIIKPRMRLFLQDQDPIQIREHLKQYMEENLSLQEEHLSDIIGRLLRI